jgi:CHASE3 domain sensor protein
MQKLGAGFAAVLVLTILIGLFSLGKLALVNEATADIATKFLQSQGHIQHPLTWLRGFWLTSHGKLQCDQTG